MADNDQNQNQNQNQSQPQRGIPGIQAPPVPSEELIRNVMAEQAKQRAIDTAEAQRRAAELAKNMDGKSVHSIELKNTNHNPNNQSIPNSIASQMPPQMQDAFSHGSPQELPNTESTMQSNKFSQYADQKPADKPEVPWHPLRNKGISVELEDSIITLVPEDGIPAEGNPTSKIILALFSELLYLRDVVASIGKDGTLSSRVYALEQTLYEQRNALSQRARSVREQVELLQLKGLTPDEIVASLSNSGSEESNG